MKNIAICLIAFLSLVLAAPVGAREGEKTDFAVGQVWSYHTQPGDDESVLVIVKIEHDARLGTIVHIAVVEVHLRGANRRATEIDHMPFAEAALRQSVIEVVGQANELPDWKPGYDEWKASFDEGNAGIYTITVAEAVKITADMMPKH